MSNIHKAPILPSEVVPLPACDVTYQVEQCDVMHQVEHTVSVTALLSNTEALLNQLHTGSVPSARPGGFEELGHWLM